MNVLIHSLGWRGSSALRVHQALGLLSSSVKILIYLKLLFICTCVGMCLPWYTYGGQQTTYKTHLFPRSSGLTASPFLRAEPSHQP